MSRSWGLFTAALGYYGTDGSMCLSVDSKGRALLMLFLFSDVFFPIDERLSAPWQVVAELLPLLHPVRAARAAFAGTIGWQTLWDVGYVLGVSALLLAFARRTIHKRLTA